MSLESRGSSVVTQLMGARVARGVLSSAAVARYGDRKCAKNADASANRLLSNGFERTFLCGTVPRILLLSPAVAALRCSTAHPQRPSRFIERSASLHHRRLNLFIYLFKQTEQADVAFPSPARRFTQTIQRPVNKPADTSKAL